MLIGIWRNIEELEASINVKELEAIVGAAREQEFRKNKFLAAIQGIDLDGAEDAKERFDEIQKRALERLTGKSVETQEFEELGIDIETDSE
jgi:hypothetical protein